MFVAYHDVMFDVFGSTRDHASPGHFVGVGRERGLHIVFHLTINRFVRVICEIQVATHGATSMLATLKIRPVLTHLRGGWVKDGLAKVCERKCERWYERGYG